MKQTETSLFKSASSVMIFVVVLKLIAFGKQAVVAAYLGANAQTDAYFVAYGLIESIYMGFFKSISISIVSIYTLVRINENREKAEDLISALLELFVGIAIILSAILFIFSKQFAFLIAPSYSEDGLLLVAFYLKMQSGLLVFMVFELIGGAVLDSHKKFIIGRMQSLFLSVSVVIACVFLVKYLFVLSLVFAYYVSSILFTVLIIISIKKYISFSFVNPFQTPRVKEIIRLAFPVMIGYSAISINHLVGRSIASSLGIGAVSSLYYSQVLDQLVTSIIIVNVGNVMFSYFSTYNAEKQTQEIEHKLYSILSILILLLIPISYITFEFSSELVKIVYFRGDFTIEAVEYTAAALKGYALAFPFVAVRDILTKSMYSFQDTASPMRNVTVSLILGIAFSIVLSRFMGIFGITLGTGLSVFVGAILNTRSIYKHLPHFNLKRLIVTGGKGLISIGLTIVIIRTIFRSILFYEFNLIGFFGVIVAIFFIYTINLLLLREQSIKDLIWSKRRK